MAFDNPFFETVEHTVMRGVCQIMDWVERVLHGGGVASPWRETRHHSLRKGLIIVNVLARGEGDTF
jgi:hypothetical protein